MAWNRDYTEPEFTDSYVFPFEPNPDWSSFYAGEPEIWEYMKKTSVKWGLEQFVKFNAKVTDTIWDEDSGKWQCKINQQGNIINDDCDILINASGFLKYVFALSEIDSCTANFGVHSKWSWPNIPGLHTFKGDLLHTANW